MSLVFNWEAISNDFVSEFLVNTINYVIMLNKHHLLGGFAYVDELRLGETPPVFEFVSIDHISDDNVAGVIHFGYNSNLFVKVQAYAPINPLQSTSKFQKRARLHMNLAESAAPGFINAWACIQDLHIDGTARIEFKKITPAQHMQYILAFRQEHPDNDCSDDEIKVPMGFVTITLDSFPIKSVKLSFAFDGSVLSSKVGDMINDNIRKINHELSQQDYSFTVPI